VCNESVFRSANVMGTVPTQPMKTAAARSASRAACAASPPAASVNAAVGTTLSPAGRAAGVEDFLKQLLHTSIVGHDGLSTVIQPRFTAERNSASEVGHYFSVRARTAATSAQNAR